MWVLATFNEHESFGTLRVAYRTRVPLRSDLLSYPLLLFSLPGGRDGDGGGFVV